VLLAKLRLCVQWDQFVGRLEAPSTHWAVDNFTRITPGDFKLLINLIVPKIVKGDTRFRAAIPVQKRLAVTLRHLATGDLYASLQYLFEISKQTISGILPEVCAAIAEALKENIHIKSSVFVKRTLFCT
jgi:hypothetical protein